MHVRTHPHRHTHTSNHTPDVLAAVLSLNFPSFITSLPPPQPLLFLLLLLSLLLFPDPQLLLLSASVCSWHDLFFRELAAWF